MPSSRDEFSLIDWIRRRVPGADWLDCGIGDDAAVVRFDATSVMATDMLMEGTHFRFPDATPAQAGRKALAVNLSDMAAMAARPKVALISIAIPRDRDRAFAEAVLGGIHSLADEFDVMIVGGDTNSWAGPLVVNVAVIGEVVKTPVYRSGALEGDWIMATGSFGGSIAGHHLDFQPRVAEALRLSETVNLHSMIDISDGLAADLHHILDESGVGAVVNGDAIPIRDSLICHGDRTPIEHALGDGEDFELIFTVSADDGKRLLQQSPVEVGITHIGKIVAAGDRQLISDGKQMPLPQSGWEHSFGM